MAKEESGGERLAEPKVNFIDGDVLATGCRDEVFAFLSFFEHPSLFGNALKSVLVDREESSQNFFQIAWGLLSSWIETEIARADRQICGDRSLVRSQTGGVTDC